MVYISMLGTLLIIAVAVAVIAQMLWTNMDMVLDALLARPSEPLVPVPARRTATVRLTAYRPVRMALRAAA